MARSSAKRKPVANTKKAPVRPVKALKKAGKVITLQQPVRLLVGTKKGAWIFTSDRTRKIWKMSAPLFFGHIVHHFVADPRNPRTLMVAAKTGHLGPTVYRSLDRGKTWKEASRPPAFSSDTELNGKKLSVDKVFSVFPGHISEPGTWFAGSAPAGLFVSRDDGDTWTPIRGFNQNQNYAKWTEQGGTPDGQFLHSILIDPRDPKHMYIGISIGGVFETTDAGHSWAPLNKGCVADFLPDPNAAYGHDPHWVVMHPKNPDRLYQQNHCGIYRLDRPSHEWIRIGKNMPKAIGDVGFPIVVHPRDPDTAFVFPMDATTVWPRTSPGGKPAAYSTHDAGKTWERLDGGFPKSQSWLTVYRQAMACDRHPTLGLYLGTTGGEVWASKNEGGTWQCLARHLPAIYSVAVAES